MDNLNQLLQPHVQELSELIEKNEIDSRAIGSAYIRLSVLK